jgi:hypothetical protein
MNSFIKWQYITVNDYEQVEFIIDLTTPNLIKANQDFQLHYPELYEVLFDIVEPGKLKLTFPKTYYLGTDSRGLTDMILRKFLDDDSNNSAEDIKPITLSGDKYPLKVYELFSLILGNNCFPENDNYGILELGFNDTNGHVCCNGEEEHEISITISEKGVKWSWWPNL